MSTLPALIGFQVPQTSLADTYTAMARLAAYDASRRSSLLEQEEKRGRLDREALWRQTIAGALQPPETVPGQALPRTGSGGFAAPQPPAPAPPPAQGFTAAAPFTQTMAQQVPPATPEQGGYAMMAPRPSLPPAGTSYGTAPIDLQSRVGLEGMAGPPPHGGGFTQPPAATPDAPQGFTGPQPTRPLSASVPNLMPMPNAEAVQQAFAIDPEKTSQWYGAYLTQRGKQLDEVKRNNQLVYQTTSAILENPQYYAEGLDSLREQGVPVPKNMPPTYDPALVKFHRDVSRERLNPLEEAQMENQRALAQLNKAKAGTEEAFQRELVRPGDGGLLAPGTGAGAVASPPRDGGQAPAASDATRAIRAEAVRQGVDPDLAVAVATQESYLNPNAVGDGGRSRGYFQLQEGAARDVGIDPAKRHEPDLNITGGVAYLKKQLEATGGDVDKALRRYNGGGDPNYVENVRRFLPKSASASAQPETRASTNPQVQRLNQQITTLEGQMERFKGLALMGHEGAKAFMDDARADIKRLTDERNRLEEPQQAAGRVTAEEQARYQQKQQQQAGPLLPEDRRKLLTGLRSDIRQEPTFKTYQEVRNGYQNVRTGAEANNAQGDLAIVNGIAKILDPGSTVREGEFQTVESAQGRLQVLMNTTQKFFEGDRLTPENRQKFLDMAQKLAQQKMTTAEKELRQVYEPFAKEGNFQFSQLLPIEAFTPYTIGKTEAGASSPSAKEDLLKKHTR